MHDLTALVSTGNDLVEGTPDVGQEVAAFSNYMFKHGEMADIQDKLTKVHNKIRPIWGNMPDEETHLSFSSVGQESNDVFRQLEVLIFICTLTTLM